MRRGIRAKLVVRAPIAESKLVPGAGLCGPPFGVGSGRQAQQLPSGCRRLPAPRVEVLKFGNPQEGCKHSLDVHIPVDAVAAEIEKSSRRCAPKRTFRASVGAPASIIRSKFMGDIGQEALENLIPVFLEKDVEGEPAGCQPAEHQGPALPRG